MQFMGSPQPCPFQPSISQQQQFQHPNMVQIHEMSGQELGWRSLMGGNPSPQIAATYSMAMQPNVAAFANEMRMSAFESVFEESVGGTDEAVSQGGYDGSMAQDKYHIMLEFGGHGAQYESEYYYTNGHQYEEMTINNQQQCEPVLPCSTWSEGQGNQTSPSRGKRKRDKRDKNWTEEESSVLVECKRIAFHDKGSRFRKPNSVATNWDAISEELKNNVVTRSSEKIGDQCRLRWDTMVKSHRAIKEHCGRTKKQYGEVSEEEIGELKLATSLRKEWYEVLDAISGEGRTGRCGKVTSSDGDTASSESGLEKNWTHGTSGSLESATGMRSHPNFSEVVPAVATNDTFVPCRPSMQDASERLRRGKSSRKQIAIAARFKDLNRQQRSTLFDLIIYSKAFQYLVDCGAELTEICEWLSIVQHRRSSETHNDVMALVTKELVRFSLHRDGVPYMECDGLLKHDEFVKKVVTKNPDHDTQRMIQDKTMSTFDSSSVPQRVTVLVLCGCEELEMVNLRHLPKLRSLFIRRCPKLEVVMGWKHLKELGWLDIGKCPAYEEYPALREIPSLQYFCSFRDDHLMPSSPSPPLVRVLGMSQCIRLRRLEIRDDKLLTGSGDLSPLKCLEILRFCGCCALSSICGLSELKSLTTLDLEGCESFLSLPDIGHMKDLAHLVIAGTGVEEIPGVEGLVGLRKFNCNMSKLRRLPDLRDLRHLELVFGLRCTPMFKLDPSSSYFDRQGWEWFGSGHLQYVEVSDMSDTEQTKTPPRQTVHWAARSNSLPSGDPEPKRNRTAFRRTGQHAALPNECQEGETGSTDQRIGASTEDFSTTTVQSLAKYDVSCTQAMDEGLQDSTLEKCPLPISQCVVQGVTQFVAETPPHYHVSRTNYVRDRKDLLFDAAEAPSTGIGISGPLPKSFTIANFAKHRPEKHMKVNCSVFHGPVQPVQYDFSREEETAWDTSIQPPKAGVELAQKGQNTPLRTLATQIGLREESDARKDPGIHPQDLSDDIVFFGKDHKQAIYVSRLEKDWEAVLKEEVELDGTWVDFLLAHIWLRTPCSIRRHYFVARNWTSRSLCRLLPTAGEDWHRVAEWGIRTLRGPRGGEDTVVVPYYDKHHWSLFVVEREKTVHLDALPHVHKTKQCNDFVFCLQVAYAAAQSVVVGSSEWQRIVNRKLIRVETQGQDESWECGYYICFLFWQYVALRGAKGFCPQISLTSNQWVHWDGKALQRWMLQVLYLELKYPASNYSPPYIPMCVEHPTNAPDVEEIVPFTAQRNSAPTGPNINLHITRKLSDMDVMVEKEVPPPKQ